MKILRILEKKKHVALNLRLSKIKIYNLKNISVENGNVMHILKSSDRGFEKFGEAYFSYINSFAVKAWKKHKHMTLNLVVPIGKVKFVFHDKNYPNQFREEIIGEDNYCRLTVPPDIWFGFQGLSDYPSLIINISDIEHDDKENIKVDIDTFAFKWSKQQ